jgi:hypothetical protein
MIKISESLYGFSDNVEVSEADVDALKKRILKASHEIANESPRLERATGRALETAARVVSKLSSDIS